jgi:hypothetical protein
MIVILIHFMAFMARERNRGAAGGDAHVALLARAGHRLTLPDRVAKSCLLCHWSDCRCVFSFLV